MANLKEIRTRINSVNSTKQVTSAMKLVSAAKLRKGQDAIVRLRPYAQKLHDILVNLSQSAESESENIYSSQRSPEKILIVLFTSSRGLCGAYNSNAIKKAIELANTKYAAQLEKACVHFLCIGKKGEDALKYRGYKVIETHHELYDNLSFSNIRIIAELVMEKFTTKKYDRIDVVYHEFQNAAIQQLKTVQYLPIEINKEENKKGKGLFRLDYIYEPNKEFIIQELIPKSLKIEFFRFALDTFASEQGSRMTAMHIATDNAGQIIKELQLKYNKARQASITGEILEIVGGAEALK